MPDRLLDTTLWIDFSHGKQEAIRFIERARGEGGIACSVVNVMEILVYAENEKDRRRMEAIFKTFEVLPVTKEDGWQARRLIRAYAASSGIGVLDAIIAATAMREDLVLATHNLKDFQRITGLKVERPY